MDLFSLDIWHIHLIYGGRFIIFQKTHTAKNIFLHSIKLGALRYTGGKESGRQ